MNKVFVDPIELLDNDFVQTGNLFFNRKNIIQKTHVNPWQILSMAKSHFTKRVIDEFHNPDYSAGDLLDEISEYVQRASLSVGGRSVASFNKLWNINSVKHKLKKGEKEEKLEYE